MIILRTDLQYLKSFSQILSSRSDQLKRINQIYKICCMVVESNFSFYSLYYAELCTVFGTRLRVTAVASYIVNTVPALTEPKFKPRISRY